MDTESVTEKKKHFMLCRQCNSYENIAHDFVEGNT